MERCIFCDCDESCGLADVPIMKDKELNLGIIENITLNLTLQNTDELCMYVMNQYGDVLEEFTSKIQYCPICGRKLKNEEEEE